jgi:serine-type D-Ala-D-Ala endopeptidase (penicillin-binding protein 7)
MIKNLLLWTILVIVSYPVSSTNILAKSWLIADGDGNVIDAENIEIQQPIASITKLMTAMVVLDAHPNLTTTLDKKLRGLPVTRGQLINLAIIKSDNQAAKMLCEYYHRGYNTCIDDMNHKAQVLGMHETKFADSSGLDNKNVSTPRDLIRLLLAAEKYPEIVFASNQAVGELVRKKKNKFIKWRYTNTNPLVAKYNVIVSKTGYVRASGGCLVMSVMIDGKKKLFVVLNSTTTRTRIRDMEQLIISHIAKS